MECKHDKNAWLTGAKVQCDVPPQFRQRPWRLVLLGAPGVGKGTQAELLSKRLGSCHLSTGDVFRAAKAASHRSPALESAFEYMRQGELVPDDTVLDIVRERVGSLHCPGGFLLDGFPRTVAQAEALTQILKMEKLALDAVLNYEMPIQQIVDRISGRRTCPSCKSVYHVVTLPPKTPGVCDKCGTKLIQREDDRPEAVRVRMQVYERSTAPLIDYYHGQGVLLSIPAEGTPEQVYERTLKALKAKAPAA